MSQTKRLPALSTSGRMGEGFARNQVAEDSLACDSRNPYPRVGGVGGGFLPPRDPHSLLIRPPLFPPPTSVMFQTLASTRGLSADPRHRRGAVVRRGTNRETKLLLRSVLIYFSVKPRSPGELGSRPAAVWARPKWSRAEGPNCRCNSPLRRTAGSS